MFVNAAARLSPWASNFGRSSLPWQNVTSVQLGLTPTSLSSERCPSPTKSRVSSNTFGAIFASPLPKLKPTACCSRPTVPFQLDESVMNLLRLIASDLLTFCSMHSVAQSAAHLQRPIEKEISLPSGKKLEKSVPGSPQRTSSLTVTMALSPDR